MSAVVFLAIAGIGALSLLMEGPARRREPSGIVNGLGTNEVDPSKLPDVPPGTTLRLLNHKDIGGYQPTALGPMSKPPSVRPENIAHD